MCKKWINKFMDLVREAFSHQPLMVEEHKWIIDLCESNGFVKSGKTYKRRCVFHDEKTPSMHVDHRRGIWHCFGCGRGGNDVALLMFRVGEARLVDEIVAGKSINDIINAINRKDGSDV